MKGHQPSLTVVVVLVVAWGAVGLAGCGSSSTASTKRVGPEGELGRPGALHRLEEENKKLDKENAQEEKGNKELEKDVAKEEAKENRETEAAEEIPSEQEAVEREHKIERLLDAHHAVGMSTASIKHAIGSPDHTQDVAGVVYWYYRYGGNEYQLTISSGVVSSVNKY